MKQPSPNPDVTNAYQPELHAASRNQERFSPGVLLAARYRVVAQLGKGGMGEVYRADDLTLGQPVALKFLPAHIVHDRDRLARFHKEVALARKVSHPHVCRVYDIGQHDEQTFLTMEFIDGEDLSSVLKRLGRVPEEKGVEIARQLCGALAAVHDQGLLHRDLKPANVMLDGRGKIRLTDFGLAAAAQDLSASEVRSGTPLYQAPEQLGGKEVTVRSDLYALGLVLYELFTGKRAFSDSQRFDPPSKPSSHVSGLSPAVETIILKCLELEPSHRPRSATEVLSRLPGGDPLAAAVAAGETPSPRLVADAPLEGTLRPAVAVTAFLGIVALIFVIAALNDRFKAHRHIPLPPPAVLEEKARQIVRELGYTEPPADTADGFEMPEEHQYYMARHGSQPAVPLDRMEACRPALAVYWLRQSPRPLVPVRYNNDPSRKDRLSATNPPTDLPGMVTLRTDTRGRLVRFVAVPDPSAAPASNAIDWDLVLKLAELDGAGVSRTDSTAAPTPPVFADQIRGWTGHYPELPEMAIRVEAASYRDRLVYFRITHPDWGEMPRDRPIPILNFGPGYLTVVDTINALMTIALLFFAVRNLRRGRADLRGALILAAIIFVGQMLFWLLAGGHFSRLGLAFPLWVNETALTLFACALAAASYLALEPVIRRRCPHRLTAWTRLTSGRWRDPLVGRDVLLGMLVGVAATVDSSTMPFFPSRWGPTVVNTYAFLHPLGELAGDATAAIGSTWVYAGLFAVLLVVARREWIATAILGAILLFFVLTSTGFPLLHVGFMALRVAAMIFLLLRLGMLSVVACLFAALVLQSAPLSLDGTAWYFGSSLTHFAALVALAGYAAWTSLGGRPLWSEELAPDD